MGRIRFYARAHVVNDGFHVGNPDPGLDKLRRCRQRFPSWESRLGIGWIALASMTAYTSGIPIRDWVNCNDVNDSFHVGNPNSGLGKLRQCHHGLHVKNPDLALSKFRCRQNSIRNHCGKDGFEGTPRFSTMQPCTRKEIYSPKSCILEKWVSLDRACTIQKLPRFAFLELRLCCAYTTKYAKTPIV